MDLENYQRCMEHLHAAERCMTHAEDGWHLVRLSHVIEALKEEFMTRRMPRPPCDKAR